VPVHAPPRWFALLPLLAIAAWWPLAPYWQSDDFLAVHHTRALANTVRDFAGPQYGAADLFTFYRPLISFAFWLEQAIGGPFPPLSHWTNVLAHAASTLLVALLWRRFVPDAAAFAAAALWCVLPSHQGSVAWAVGRVDAHTAVWCLLAVWAALRAHERRTAGAAPRAWLPALLTAGALASKELALVLPAAATLVVACRADGSLRARATAALRATVGCWLVLAAYVPWRVLVLGSFGGYDAARWDVAAIATGLPNGLASIGVPLRWVGTPPGGAVPASVWLAAAALPVALAVVRGAARRPAIAAAATATFLVALLPIANFVAASDNPQTLRLWYVPTTALVGVLASAGRWLVLAVLLAWAAPFVAMRAEQHAADADTAARHAALLQRATEPAPQPWFVAGLPVVDGPRNVVQLRFGVDRLLAPPFTPAPVATYALRPLLDAGFALAPPGAEPAPLPAGSTWSFADAATLRAVAPAPPLPELVVAGDIDAAGTVDLRSERLAALLDPAVTAPRLVTPGVRTDAFRLTVFTANGYLATLFENHAQPGAADGLIDVRAWFSALGTLRIGSVAPGVYIGDALQVPTVVDLVPEFPALLEGGTVDRATLAFTATHRARLLVVLRFDRGYAAWVRRAQGR
jgi:hypothetical protein